MLLFCFVDFMLLHWVVPENIRTPTTGAFLKFRMHGGVLWPGILNAQGGGGVAGIGIRNA